MPDPFSHAKILVRLPHSFLATSSWCSAGCSDISLFSTSAAVKFTYTATARSAQDGCIILCSARQESTDGKESKYNQPIPIPSYLVAIAGGRLEFAELGSECGVWAEPSIIKDATWEFEETQKFLDAGEKLIGPYPWGRYDVLVSFPMLLLPIGMADLDSQVLPKSFPYGGM